MNKLQKYAQPVLLKSWRPYLWIVLSSLIIYGHVILFSEYTQYDDHFLIVDNYSKIDELSDIGHLFLEDVGHQGQGGNLYRPILNVTFVLGAQISGTELWGHFLINVLIHIGACLFLFVMLLNMNVPRAVSFILSMIFTVHPALTQAVAWISGRNDSLLALFILPCFIYFLKFISKPSYKSYFLHMLFFALALFTKETTIIFPFILLFYALFIHKSKVDRFRLLSLMACWFIVFVNWYVLRISAQIAKFMDPQRVIKNLISDTWIVFFYFGKILWPFNLAFGPVEFDVNILPGIITAILLIGIILMQPKRDWKTVVFGLLWFGMFIIPTLVYHSNKIDYHIPYYEHRIYVPMIGIVIILTTLSFTMKKKISGFVIPALSFLVVVLFGWRSHEHTYRFQNPLMLRQYAAESSPHDIWLYSSIERMKLPPMLKERLDTYRIPPDAPQVDRADTVRRSRRTRDLRPIFEAKSKYDPFNGQLTHSLAILDFARGFFIKAEKSFIAAKALDPQNADICFNMGILYYDAFRFKQCEQEWLAAVKLNPMLSDGFLNLTYLYYQLGQFNEAWVSCQEALKRGAPVPGGLIQEISNKRSIR